MLKLVDRPDLGSGVVRRVGSSPTTRTIWFWTPFTFVDGVQSFLLLHIIIYKDKIRGELIKG